MTIGLDHLNAWLALLSADSSLNPYHGVVPDGAPARYALFYFYLETPDGLQAPDAVDLTFASNVVTAWAYVHSVGSTPESALIEADRVRAAVLNKTPQVTGRSCHPIYWDSGQPPQRNEEIPGTRVFDKVDVYSWRSVPG